MTRMPPTSLSSSAFRLDGVLLFFFFIMLIPALVMMLPQAAAFAPAHHYQPGRNLDRPTAWSATERFLQGNFAAGVAESRAASSSPPAVSSPSSSSSSLPWVSSGRSSSTRTLLSSHTEFPPGAFLGHHPPPTRRTEGPALRQRFVTGRYPLQVHVGGNALEKWLLQAGQATRHFWRTVVPGRKRLHPSVPPLFGLASTRSSYAHRATELFVNGTRLHFQQAYSGYLRDWLETDCREEAPSKVTVELIGEIPVRKPGFVHVGSKSKAASAKRLTAAQTAVPQAPHSVFGSAGEMLQEFTQGARSSQTAQAAGDQLWVTGFELMGPSGIIQSVDCQTGEIASVKPSTSRSIPWPNEVNTVPQFIHPPTVAAAETARTKGRLSNPSASTEDQVQDALLVCDGFLVPGKDQGGIYVVKNPGSPEETQTCLTKSATTLGGTEENERWFYHRATWIDMNLDGRRSILAARSQVNLSTGAGSSWLPEMKAQSQLVWLESPKPAMMDPLTGKPLEADGSDFDPFHPCHLPWRTHVLGTGPDVLFSVADLNPSDDTIELISAQFFQKRVVLQSIQLGADPKIVFERTLDDDCGAAFSIVLADLDLLHNEQSSCSKPQAIYSPGGNADGQQFSHIILTTHESGDFVTPDKAPGAKAGSMLEGGSLFSYRVPTSSIDAWKYEPWTRTTMATGFKVRPTVGNLMGPGAPGFVYTFYEKKADAEARTKRPLIAIAGDCTGSAYLLRPIDDKGSSDRISQLQSYADPASRYEQMVEICCGATVGSIGIGYEDYGSADQESGYAKLYIPCYEKDTILVFALGSEHQNLFDFRGLFGGSCFEPLLS